MENNMRLYEFLRNFGCHTTYNNLFLSSTHSGYIRLTIQVVCTKVLLVIVLFNILLAVINMDGMDFVIMLLHN